MTDEEIEVLLSGYLDNELTQQEEQKVRLFLQRDPHYREILEDLQRVKSETAGLSYEEPSPEEWKTVERHLIQDSSRRLGWIILSVWATVTLGYGLWKFWTAPQEPLMGKLLSFGLFLGLGLLFLSVVIERVRESRHDRYKGVLK